MRGSFTSPLSVSSCLFSDSVSNLFLTIARGGRVNRLGSGLRKVADALKPGAVTRLDGEVLPIFTVGCPNCRRRELSNLIKARRMRWCARVAAASMRFRGGTSAIKISL